MKNANYNFLVQGDIYKYLVFSFFENLKIVNVQLHKTEIISKHTEKGWRKQMTWSFARKNGPNNNMIIRRVENKFSVNRLITYRLTASALLFQFLSCKDCCFYKLYIAVIIN